MNMNRSPEILADGSWAAGCGLQQCFYTSARVRVAMRARSAPVVVSFRLSGSVLQGEAWHGPYLGLRVGMLRG
ncbi:hypothetical protein, partial [Delftia acidovorans]|uniref:hypothetical protein n=1 Tax=Delftia acidovorans TaxID=80866 RepID=UPI0035A03B08